MTLIIVWKLLIKERLKAATCMILNLKQTPLNIIRNGGTACSKVCMGKGFGVRQMVAFHAIVEAMRSPYLRIGM